MSQEHNITKHIRENKNAVHEKWDCALSALQLQSCTYQRFDLKTQGIKFTVKNDVGYCLDLNSLVGYKWINDNPDVMQQTL